MSIKSKVQNFLFGALAYPEKAKGMEREFASAVDLGARYVAKRRHESEHPKFNALGEALNKRVYFVDGAVKGLNPDGTDNFNRNVFREATHLGIMNKIGETRARMDAARWDGENHIHGESNVSTNLPINLAAFASVGVAALASGPVGLTALGITAVAEHIVSKRVVTAKERLWEAGFKLGTVQSDVNFSMHVPSYVEGHRPEQEIKRRLEAARGRKAERDALKAQGKQEPVPEKGFRRYAQKHLTFSR